MNLSSNIGRRSAGFIVTLAALLIAGCGGGGEESAAAPSQGTAPEPAQVSAGDNSAPVIQGTPTMEAQATQSFVFQPVASDPDGDPLTFSAQGLPSWASIDPATGRITGLPTEDDAGETADIIITVTDGKQTSSLEPFRLQIKAAAKPYDSVPGNAAPTISGTPKTEARVGTAWSFSPTATDADSLTLVYSITNKPNWASFSTTTGTLSGTPAASHVGKYADIVISVTDGKQQASLPPFTVTVAPAPNAAPTISGTPKTTVTAGTAYSFVPTASDPQKQALGFSITNKPSWATFNTATGALTGTPSAGNVGSFANIVISVSDGTNKTSLSAFTITVQAAPVQGDTGGSSGSTGGGTTQGSAPKISGTPATTAKVGTTYTFQPTATDADGDKLTFAISGKPSWATFDTATGKLTGKPGSNDIGNFGNVSITVTDGRNTASLPSFSILVSAPTMGSATLSWTPPQQNTDGTSLTNLAGYRIYYGTDSKSLDKTIVVSNAGITSYTVGNLTAGKYYFAVAAYTTDGVESELSTVGSKTIL